MTLERSIRQLRTEVANSRFFDDAYTKVLTNDLDAVLAEVDRLNQHVTKLKGDLSALRGWTRSRLQVLADRRHDYPETPEQRGKRAVLDDLTSVLDHLDTIPAPDATTTEESGR